MGRTLVFVASDHARPTLYLEESLQLFDALGDSARSMQVRLHLGMVAMQGRHLAVALEQLQTALQLAWAIKNYLMVAYCYEALGGTALTSGAVPQAVELFGVAERMRAWLDDANFNAHWAEGQALSPEQALERGLSLTLPIA